MTELLAIGIISAYLAIGYLIVYPKAKGVVQLRIFDLIITVLSLATVGAVFWNSDANFQMVFFEANWLVFSVVVYVLLETPLWYFYMKAHPRQGTLAELYGLSKGQRSAKAASNIDQVMRDTKWDAIRTARAQKLLVALGALALVASPITFWFESLLKPGIAILSVLPIFLIWWLLRISVRLVADAPDQYLDEFQIRQRDRTYLHSFRILAGIVSALAVSLMIVTISKDFSTVGNVDYYRFDLTFSQVQAVIWAILGSTILVPNMVLAWNQSKEVSN